MAITKCVECNGNISTSAKMCPHCGKPNPTTSATLKYGGRLLALIMIVATIFAIFGKDNSSTPTPTVTSGERSNTAIKVSPRSVAPAKSPQQHTISTLQADAARGDPKAQSTLGDLYRLGQGVPQDYAEAALWYRRAADQGYSDAQYNLGNLYEVGQGVPQDNAQAIQWVRKSADQGNATAQGLLGLMYEDGEGVPKDEAQAIQWLRKGAENGDAYAQCILGHRYHDGKVVPQDYAQAALWYREAAAQGNGPAQLSLGVMYQFGEGVPQLPVVAYALFGLDDTEEGLSDNAARIARTMTPKEIDAGQNLMRNLAKPGNFLVALNQYVSRLALNEGSPIESGINSPAAVKNTPPITSVSSQPSEPPTPEAPSPKQSSAEPGSPALSEDLWRKYNAEERAAPLERKAVLFSSTDEFLKAVDTLVLLVRRNGYECDSVSSARPTLFSRGYALSCDTFSHDYTIKDKGGQWTVTVD